MTNADINKRVAEEVMGWRLERTAARRNNVLYETCGWFDGNSELQSLQEDFNPAERIDHAWMVEERIAELDLVARYLKALIKIVHGNAVKVFSDLTIMGFWYLVHATPEQRCLAALEAVKEGE